MTKEERVCRPWLLMMRRAHSVSLRDPSRVSTVAASLVVSFAGGVDARLVAADVGSSDALLVADVDSGSRGLTEWLAVGSTGLVSLPDAACIVRRPDRWFAWRLRDFVPIETQFLGRIAENRGQMKSMRRERRKSLKRVAAAKRATARTSEDWLAPYAHLQKMKESNRRNKAQR